MAVTHPEQRDAVTLDVPRPSRGHRIRESSVVHRVAPTAAGLSYARLRARRWWASDPRVRAHARLQMEFLLGQRLSSEQIDAVAKRYLFENLRREEYDWRPWLTTRAHVERLDVLREAQAAGNGVVLSIVHHGYVYGVFGAMARCGVGMHVAAATWFSSSQFRDGNTKEARIGQRRLATMTQPGITLFGANGSYSRMVESLRDGDTVAIASDMPGRTETTFLGRSVRSASGAARLAVDTGAVIVPVTSHRAGQRYRYRLEDPIHVAAADDYRRVLGRIMAAHEPAVLAWPEAYERPLRRFLPVTTEDVARFGYPLDEYFHRFVI